MDAGVLELLMYELDHAAVVLDHEDNTRMHTVRWGGAWSYNRLNLTEEDRRLDERLKGGPSGQCCSVCESTELVPVTDVVERALPSTPSRTRRRWPR